eukprot:6176875-Pleurochrysis_carterae.AAC.5
MGEGWLRVWVDFSGIRLKPPRLGRAQHELERLRVVVRERERAVDKGVDRHVGEEREHAVVGQAEHGVLKRRRLEAQGKREGGAH